MIQQEEQKDKDKKEDEMETEFIPETDLDNVAPEKIDVADKIKRLRLELKQCQDDKQEYLTMSQRLKADYANLKRQEEERRESVVKLATSDLLSEFLQVADSFELAFSHKELWAAAPAGWRAGVEQIYGQLMAILRRYGLQEFGAPGDIFSPERHHALETIEVDDSRQDNTLAEIIQKGYILNDKIIRPAKVKVNHLKLNKN